MLFNKIFSYTYRYFHYQPYYSWVNISRDIKNLKKIRNIFKIFTIFSYQTLILQSVHEYRITLITFTNNIIPIFQHFLDHNEFES